MANTVSVNVVADVKNINRGIQEVNSKLSGFGQSVSKIGGLVKSAFGGMAAVFAGAKVLSFFEDSVAAARESNKVNAQTAAVLKSTGSAAGITAQQISNLSTALSNKTAVDDEVIQSGANLLLTFTNIHNAAGKGNDIFNQTVAIANDMSVALGQDMKSSSIQLGKALNDPIKGVTALQRVGVSFTESQKKQIKTLVDSGKTLQAQKVILGEVTKEFGGSAAAAATPFDKLKVTLGNLQESLGNKLIPVIDRFATYVGNNLPTWLADGQKAIDKLKQVWSEIGPTVESVLTSFKDMATTFVSNLIPAVESLGGFLQKYQGWILPIAAGVTAMVAAWKTYQIIMGIVTAVTEAYTAVQEALDVVMAANPIGLVILAIVGLVAIIIIAWKHSQTFRDVLIGAWNAIKAATSAVWGAIKATVKAVFDAFMFFIKNFTLPGLIISHWNQIKAVTSAVWNAIKGAVGSAINWIGGLVSSVFHGINSTISGVWNAVKGATSSAWNGIKNAVSSAISGMMGFINGIRGRVMGALSGVGSWLYSAGRNLLQGMINGLSSMARRLADAALAPVRKAVDAVKGFLGINSPSKLFMQFGVYTNEGLALGLQKTVGVKKAAQGMAKAVADNFDPKLSLKGDIVAGGSGNSGNNYTLNVEVPVGSNPEEIGRTIVEYIKQFESAGGTRWRSA